MAVSFPEQPELVNSSEKYVYEKLMTLSDSWHVYANMQQHITRRALNQLLFVIFVICMQYRGFRF